MSLVSDVHPSGLEKVNHHQRVLNHQDLSGGRPKVSGILSLNASEQQTTAKRTVVTFGSKLSLLIRRLFGNNHSLTKRIRSQLVIPRRCESRNEQSSRTRTRAKTKASEKFTVAKVSCEHPNERKLVSKTIWPLNEPTKSAEENNEDYDCEKDLDGGYAWIILLVMFFINASTVGASRAYGLIFERLARRQDELRVNLSEDYLQSQSISRSEAALPFTLMGAIENMAGPLAGYLLTRTQSWRLLVFMGSCLITLGHLLAALSETLLVQTLAFGLMCGLGLSCITISSFQINNAYFVRYRSRAFGIGLTGGAFGALYLSPLCKFVLDRYNTSVCYLMLGAILAPNIPLSLLLKPKRSKSRVTRQSCLQASKSSCGYSCRCPANLSSSCSTQLSERQNVSAVVETISGQINQQQQQQQQGGQKRQLISIDYDGHQNKPHNNQDLDRESNIWINIKSVLGTPLFHLIWPTQLLFCWLNFVFGMIIVDFGEDRNLSLERIGQLIPIWTLGQLIGRLLLGSLIDLKFASYRCFTIICFASISLTVWTLNNIRISNYYDNLLVPMLLFILSLFISTLYILFNGLVVDYMDDSKTALSIGISSFMGSFFLLPRATTIGYYRGTSGNYDAMLSLFTYVSLVAALIWLLVPELCKRFTIERPDTIKRPASDEQSALDKLVA